MTKSNLRDTNFGEALGINQKLLTFHDVFFVVSFSRAPEWMAQLGESGASQHRSEAIWTPRSGVQVSGQLEMTMSKTATQKATDQVVWDENMMRPPILPQEWPGE